MSIASTHAEYILDRLFVEELLEGTILTADELEELLEEYKETHPNLSVPTSKNLDFSVERGGESSADLIDTIATSVSDDVSIVSREIKSLMEKSQQYYERWTVEIQRLINKAKRIEYGIDSLLLLQNDTAGYFAHVSDNFVDLNKVDTENTDAKIDIRETTISLNPYNAYLQDSSGGSRINLSKLNKYDVTFNLLSSTPVGYSTNGESVPLNAVLSPDTNGYCWVGTAVQKKSGSVSAELKIRLSKTSSEDVSRIVYDSGTQNAGGTCSITCQWSIDGYQWYMVDDPTPTKSLDTGNAVWTFPLTSMSWVKFIIIKNNYDYSTGVSYEYDFGARSIRFFSHQYNITTGSSLYTLPQQALDAEGEPVLFTLASFDACEQHVYDIFGTQKTNIAYYLAASADGETNWTNWVRVDPSSKSSPQYPSAILFGNSTTLNNVQIATEWEDYILPFDSTTSDLYKLTRTFDWGSGSNPKYLGYNFKSSDFAVINTAIKLLSTSSNNLNPNYLSNSINVWRNTYDSSLSTRTVRDINAGWGLDGDYYYCSFFVNNSDGIILNFGDTKCIIDEVERTGEVKIFRGVHTFKTIKSNWKDYSSSYSAITSESELIEADSLYPYNHKVIIEGFPYPTDFVGERAYLGVDIIAQYYCTRTSAFDLENNIDKQDSLKYFAFVKGVGTDDAPACAILLRRDINYNDYPNEFCRISWRVGEGSFKYLKMRADFTSLDANNTSTLSSYRIKVGV